VCPNGSMGSDFSALDAELDTLGAGPLVDALALAGTYAGSLAAMSDIDAALGELDADGAALRAKSAVYGSLARASSDGGNELPTFLAGRSGLRARSEPPRLPAERASSRAPESEEIVLPDPVLRDNANESGELSLDTGTPRSGSFSLDGAETPPGNRDDTIETSEEELGDADVDLMDLQSEAPPTLGQSRERIPASLFDLEAPAMGKGQEESDAAFAALFAEATKQSDMPPLHSQPPPAYTGDTELFDTGGLGFVENLQQSAAIADSIAAEELDSAEFEIVMDDDAHSIPPSMPPPHPSQLPSQPPEKRPSFLGRLFGRKEE
jgi:hypothetical protein